MPALTPITHRIAALLAAFMSPLSAHAQTEWGGNAGSWTDSAMSDPDSFLGGGLDYAPASSGAARGSSSFSSGLNFDAPAAGGSAPVAPTGALPNPLGISTLGELVDKVSNALILLAIPVVTAMILWGAFKIATAGNNPAQVKEGGNIIKYAAIGFCLLLLASGITQVIQSLFS